MAHFDELIQANPFGDLDVPAPLEESLARHRRHLVELICAMKTAGVNEDRIEESVTELVASYKSELLVAIRSIR